jgi:Flp pilus assembly protein TadG
MLSAWKKLRREIAAFRGARGGNVAITFALATLPIIGSVGFAVDYSHANSVKAAMQAALDSTALLLAKEASTDTASQLQQNALKYFNALFTRPEAANVTISASYTATGGSQVLVNGSANVPTSFLGIIGYNNLTVNGSSTSAWGSTRLRVALVLDNTGSMADDGKITALKTATTSLLSQLQAAASTDGDVYVSIIPFSRDVSVDPSSNYSGNWIDWTDWAAAPSGSTPAANVGPGSNCPYSTYSNGFGCSPTPTSTSTTNTIPSSGTYKGYICPGVDSGSGSYYNGCYDSTTYSSTGSSATCSGHSNCSCSGSGSSKSCKTNSGYYEHAWIANAASTWNGCITDRGAPLTSGATGPSSGNYDQNVTAPISGTAASYYPAEQYSMCALPMMGLNYNWSSMTSLVNQMTPNGNTNQPIGLVWGWLSLVGGGPLTAPAMDPNYQYQQIIILLSDGLNTQDRWYTSQNSIDNRMYNSSTGAGTCANIKAAKITIYTIQVDTGGDPTSTLLQECASDSSKFFKLTSSSQILTTFNAIGTNLTKLRVAK